MQEKCIICGSDMRFYFKKDGFYNPEMSEPIVKKLTRNLLPITYLECSCCGFSLSETHRNLSPQEWEELNNNYHHYNESAAGRNLGNQPPYLEQAMMVELLIRNNIVDGSDILDYAAGYGTLRNIFQKYYDRNIKCYDKYVKNELLQYECNIYNKTWPIVINSAMFEHVLTRKDLDEVNNLVSEDGALLVHTVVVERVPHDPNWFYIDIPVHTAVHTNKSMSMLMEQWGYQSSIYSPHSKTWALLRKPYKEIKPLVDKINKELQVFWLYGKDGFMDYWKTR
ncbi:methyltransferase domain-containing protein [uncultured Citrobacter sp.]|nr:hypothetical protein BO998_03325 [Citrobacter werkmanii]